MAGPQGGLPVRLSWTPQSLQSLYKVLRRENLNKLLSRVSSSWNVPVLNMTFACGSSLSIRCSVMLALLTAVKHHDRNPQDRDHRHKPLPSLVLKPNYCFTVWMGWTMSIAASVLAGGNSLTRLIQSLAISQLCEHTPIYTRSWKGTFYSALWWTASP